MTWGNGSAIFLLCVCEGEGSPSTRRIYETPAVEPVIGVIEGPRGQMTPAWGEPAIVGDAEDTPTGGTKVNNISNSSATSEAGKDVLIYSAADKLVGR